MLNRTRQTWRLFDACGVNRQLDCKQLVSPPAAFKSFFAPYQGAPFEADSNAGAVAACQVKRLPQLRLKYAIFAVADYSAENFACQIFNLSLI